jgi:acyl transferase domain-containing protein
MPRCSKFDGEFFGFSPKESAIMDPQHRHFLECSWEALESAAHPPERFKGPIGVFAGCGMGSYFYVNVCSQAELVRDVGLFLLRHTGNDKDFLATRVSYLLDLAGPSINVQTACSTSLVATHLAVQSLLARECDMALAGGVTIELPQNRGYVYQEGEVLSPDGHCHAFDHRGQGTVFGSGVGVVVLRRLGDALDDGDMIHAVIRGTAVNNDGAKKVNYLAPSVDGQAARPYLPTDLRSLMFPTDENVERAATELERPLLNLPAIFMTEYALAQLWRSWGIEPAAMTGHSLGEYAAACLAGVLSLKDALFVVTLRGKLFETLPEGGMLSVPLSEAALQPYLTDGLSIAVINSPELCVVSGEVAALEKLEAALTTQEVECRRVRINVAAHSPMLEPILDEFGRELAKIQFNPPTMPFISNLTGSWAQPDEVTQPGYWVRHLRHTVRFADGLTTLLQEPNRIFLEVGPGQTLSALVRMHPAKGKLHTAVASLRHRNEELSDVQFALTSLGRLWLAGLMPDWGRLLRRRNSPPRAAAHLSV